jgi:two-component system response regulator YesN
LIADEITVAAHFARRAETQARRAARASADHEPPHAPNALVTQMLDYAQRRYHLPIHLDDVAEALGRSACYLCSLFSRTVGRSFHHYLDDLRLHRAKELLGNPKHSVCEVAYAVGYTDANYFRQAFKAHTGSPPMVWRQHHALVAK